MSGKSKYRKQTIDRILNGIKFCLSNDPYIQVFNVWIKINDKDNKHNSPWEIVSCKNFDNLSLLSGEIDKKLNAAAVKCKKDENASHARITIRTSLAINKKSELISDRIGEIINIDLTQKL
ncbi:hypothetical protein [Winogradskyella sp. SYSU M77433]|uniref:hypothetical protein n=1 Tax=Winogradskyella sp. SYSU M77433 TaxID=3042722 RepID=UPI0024802EF1|nr:hypothetical protein [Winogradskyella sp. SYSU M77433]MDH7913209.1 hypothetical protein [Winogradskyella sp. SYSU M77433]